MGTTIVHGAGGSLPDETLVPKLVITGGDDADGTGTASIQVQDGNGDNLEDYFMLNVWVSDTDFGQPDAINGFGSIPDAWDRYEFDVEADYEVGTDSAGLAVMDIDYAGAGSVYVMATIGGRTYSSGEIVITNP